MTDPRDEVAERLEEFLADRGSQLEDAERQWICDFLMAELARPDKAPVRLHPNGASGARAWLDGLVSLELWYADRQPDHGKQQILLKPGEAIDLGMKLIRSGWAAVCGLMK